MSTRFYCAITLLSNFLLASVTNTASASTLLKPTVRGCPSSGYTRLINVSTVSQLITALDDAVPGDQIRLAPGTYTGKFTMYESGTASAPIHICGVFGKWPKITGGTFGIKAHHLIISGILFEGPNSGNNIWSYMAHDIQFTYNEIRKGDSNAGLSMAGTYNFEISHNFIHDNGQDNEDHGLYLQGTGGSGIVVANNVIVGNAGRGISMHSNSDGAINGIQVVNNTIVRNGSTGILFSPNAGSGNVIANNILADNGNVYRYKQIRIKSGTSNKILNNILYHPSSTYAGYELDTDVYNTTIAGNINSDPKFVSLSGRDFHLTSGSPAIGLGVSAYATLQDFEYRSRDSSPDAGAFEFAGAIATPTPTPVPTATPAPTPSATPVPTATPVATPTPTPVVVGQQVIFKSIADGRVTAQYPTQNFGKVTKILADKDYDQSGYFQFSVSGLSAAPVKAVIRFYVADGSNDAPKIVQVSNSWSESTLNYNNRPAVLSGTLDDKTLVYGGGSFVDYNVTAAVKANGLISFGLLPTSADGFGVGSREMSSPPQLILTMP